MSRQSCGMVLLTTMMMLVILTLLVLSLMQNVLLYMKSTHQIIASHQIFHQMEHLATALDLTNVACTVQENDPNQLIAALSANQGCISIDGVHRYSYLIADQGEYPCLQIKVDEQWKGSHHWLLTVASLQPPALVLQWRIAQPEDTKACDPAVAHPIHSGVISWRKLH